LHRRSRSSDSIQSIIVQKKRAILLSVAWGEDPCAHPAFVREYDLGERTGNHICSQCGATFTFRERAELLAARGS
jgi:hypothetical protein